MGCGALRSGVRFARCLDPGGHHGIDKNASLLAAGAQVQIPAAGLEGRQAHLLYNDLFEFSRIDTTFHFALAQSVFTHLPLNSIERCLVEMVEVLEPGGKFYASAFEAPVKHPLQEIRWDDQIVTYSDRNPFHYHLSAFERLGEGLPWKVTFLGHWKHRRTQRMLQFSIIR